MAGSPLSDRLTAWAGASDSRLGDVVRTTVGPLLIILATPPAAITF